MNYKLYVVDTVAIISYFHDLFDVKSIISCNARSIIEKAMNKDPSIRLSIPSAVLIEIWNKWCNDEENLRKYRYEIYERIKTNPYIEIKQLDYDVILDFIKLSGFSANLERHDKVILASAISLKCHLITTDPKIKRVIRNNNLGIKVVS